MLSFKNAWEQTINKLSEYIPGAAFGLWIKPIIPVDIYNNEAVVIVKNDFTRDVILQRYSAQIEAALSEIFGFELKLHIYTEDDKPKNMKIPEKAVEKAADSSNPPAQQEKEDID